MNGTYLEEFIEDEELPTIMNSDSFMNYIVQSKNKYVTSFPNLSGDTVLVIPMPKKNRKGKFKNYSTLKKFMDNASRTQQKIFWKHVYKQIIKFRKKNKRVWISTHGKGVSYLHVRISNSPKYYEDSPLAYI